MSAVLQLGIHYSITYLFRLCVVRSVCTHCFAHKHISNKRFSVVLLYMATHRTPTSHCINNRGNLAITYAYFETQTEKKQQQQLIVRITQTRSLARSFVRELSISREYFSSLFLLNHVHNHVLFPYHSILFWIFIAYRAPVPSLHLARSTLHNK